MAGKVKDDIIGNEYLNWKVEAYLGKSKYTCRCLKCNKTKEINSYFLKKGQIPKCECETGKSNKGRIDLTGKEFGTWKVLEYSGDKKWKCKCLCGCNTVKDVTGSDLRNGKSTGCGRHSNKKIDNLTGQKFGDWLVIEHGPTGPNGETQWLCECQCENKTKRLVTSYSLKSGNSKSCGHNTTALKDLTNMQFGNWKVLYRSKIQMSTGSTDWVCECQCENKTKKILSSYVLRNEISKSCGCETQKLRIQTTLDKYGVEHVSQINTEHTDEQLNAIKSKENMQKFISEHFDHTPSAIELAEALGIKRGTVKAHLENMMLNDKITHGIKQISGYEKALKSMYPCNNVSDKTVLEGKEIDLYYPDKQFGIEFNGNYWHSELKKSSEYHQQKSVLANRKGIQLFHIFEYEWNDENTRNKLKHILSNKLYGDRVTKIYARECIIKEVDTQTTKEFLTKYHLQNYATSSVNLALVHKNEIVGIMTFNKPRFNNNCEYEMVRLSYKHDIIIIGGTEKLFKYFITKYNPISIISYCDIAKFSGEVYVKLGFKLVEITKPNYKWVDINTNCVMSRYQTQKHRLIEAGLGTEDQTEAEIMHNLGYVRIYDCGNYRFIWNKEEDNERRK